MVEQVMTHDTDTEVEKYIPVADLQGAAFPTRYIYRLNCYSAFTGTPEQELKIPDGACRNDDDDGNIISDSELTIDITASGANGLDTGSEAASTWYYVWIIYNPTTDTVAGLFSLSSTSPTLPSGYTKKRRVGSIYNDASSNFRQIRRCTCGRRRLVMFDNDVLVLEGGTATSYTDVDCSVAIPPTSRLGYIRFTVFDAGAVCRLNWRMNGSTIGIPYSHRGYEQCEGIFRVPLDDSQIFEYYVDSGNSVDVRIQGYWESL
jgi:hypothetical protein